MRPVRNIALVLVSLALVVSSASAQRAPARRTSSSAPPSTLWELGGDAALSFQFGNGSNATTLEIPVSSVRAGFFINEQWSLEPSLAIGFTKVKDVPSSSSYMLGFAGLYHLSTDRTKPQMYVRPFLALTGASFNSNSSHDTELGVGVGMKWPKLNGRMAWRGEANLARWMDAEVTALNLLWGVSFFTR